MKTEVKVQLNFIYGMRTVTPAKEKFFKRKEMWDRYGISNAALNTWLKLCGVIPPGRNGYFSPASVHRVDLFWTATRACSVACKEYPVKVISAGGLNKYLIAEYDKTLLEWLHSKHTPAKFRNHPIIQDVIATLKEEANDSHCTDRREAENQPSRPNPGVSDAWDSD